MAQSAQTFDAYDVKGGREDLADWISMISPESTPFTSNIGKGKASAIYKEWQLETLAAASTSNKHIDGDEFAGVAVSPTTVVGNYCQISRKDIVISRRANKVNKAGRNSELAKEITKKAKELKRDVEAIITGNQASLAGNSTTAGTTGSLRAWLTTNTDLATLGSPANGGFSSGIVAAATDGTARALDEAGLLAVIDGVYDNSDEGIDALMMSPTVCQLFSGYMFTNASSRIATPYQEHGANNRKGAQVLGAVQTWVTDLGTVDVVANRFQRDKDVFVLNWDLWELAYLDDYKTEEIAKIGDHERRMLIVDYCLVSKNEAGNGVFADVNPATAMAAS